MVSIDSIDNKNQSIEVKKVETIEFLGQWDCKYR